MFTFGGWVAEGMVPAKGLFRLPYKPVIAFRKSVCF